MSCGSVFVLPACTKSISFWRFFSDEEAKLVMSIAEQIIPTDKDPGATEANVINYIDKQLVGPLARFQGDYRLGLEEFQKAAFAFGKATFTDLTWDNQTVFLEKMEQGKILVEEWSEEDQKNFFRLLLEHCMQGFYGSPRHGGNCNYVSYKMMKIDYPHVIGQNRYSEKDTIDKQLAL